MATGTIKMDLAPIDISSQLVADTPVKTVNSKTMMRIGKFVFVSFKVTLNMALSHGSAIFVGLPKPAYLYTKFPCVAVNNSVHTPIIFSYSSGYLSAEYPQSGITADNSVITGTFMYVAE